jgi:hypothetical protein
MQLPCNTARTLNAGAAMTCSKSHHYREKRIRETIAERHTLECSVVHVGFDISKSLGGTSLGSTQINSTRPRMIRAMG